MRSARRQGVNPQISRVDGNHRLFFAQGFSDKKYELESLEVIIPFSITIGLDKKEEAALFSDINSNALKMNTSQLDHLRYRLLSEATIKGEELALWIAEDLSKDSDSPFHNIIYLGGKRSKKYITSLSTFKDGIQTLLRESKELSNVKILYDLKSQAIKNYWRAIKNTFLGEWNEKLQKSRANLLMSYFSYFALSKLGAVLIDRSMRKENPTVDEMQNQLVGIKRERAH
jgi:DGQHR domain-containing protein